MAANSDLGTAAHRDRVMTSVACAGCHPAIYAEHEQNTHGRAFHDEEARLATRDFRRDDCVRCHTPRPVFETGIGLTPMQRWTDLSEGNTCMSCHFKQGYDYSRFVGGKECKDSFDPRVGTVQACASCHRIAGTPDQWSRAERGQKAGKVCLDCHMREVERPVAVGEPSKQVRSHVFPASRSEDQLRRAYVYEAKIEGNEVVVKITNRGAGHNFPTATRQRAVESLVTVRDADGKVIGTSRLVCRYPYASELAPGQLSMPVGTQIPSGKSKEHRVPLPVEKGSVECELFFKLYRPIGDYDPQLSRRLEDERLYFADVTPSKEEIKDAPFVGFPAPPADIHDFFDPEGYSNVARPEPKPGPIEIPKGDSDDDVARLVALLEFHMPEARRLARERLVAIGPKAYPALIRAMGAWSNETYNEAMDTLAEIGKPAAAALVDALGSDQLYVRCHARFVLARIGFPIERDPFFGVLARGLDEKNALDRRSTATVLGELGDARAVAPLMAALDDPDWDVVAAAAKSLAKLDAKAAIPAIEAALSRATFRETKLDLGLALAQLGAPSGVPPLLDGLAESDPVVRASFFEALFQVTGQHFGYDPAGPEFERLESIAKLKSWWAQAGGAGVLRRAPPVDEKVHARARELMLALGGGTDTEAGGDDTAIFDELTGMGAGAVPALLEGLTFPSGFVQKRTLVCRALGAIGAASEGRTAPFLMAALLDPSLDVSTAACEALERAGDPEVLPALSRFQARVLALKSDARTVPLAERLVATAARSRLMLGDTRARSDVVNLLMAEDESAREIAISALEDLYGERKGYDPGASREERLEAVKAWTR